MNFKIFTSESLCIKYKSHVDLSSELTKLSRDFSEEKLVGFSQSISSNVCSFFLVIIEDSVSKSIFIISDLIRSFPYLICLDTLGEVREFQGVYNFDANLISEYQATGIISSNETFGSNVLSINAGEILKICTITKKYSITEWETYEYCHLEGLSGIEWVSKTFKVLDSAVKNLIKIARGKQIVIPLSGGLDSRLIAILLKENCYENVICFTYGLEGNWEAKVSKSVAEKLGYKWYFVEYDKEMWADLRSDVDFTSFIKRCAALHTTPHVQDWPAIKSLTERGVINSDSLLVPGHSTDFLAGSHLENAFFKSENLKVKELFELIRSKFFSYSDFTSNEVGREIIISFINSQVKGASSFPSCIGAQIFEKWDLKQRQAKFIVNSTAVYDSFSLDYYVVMWDFNVFKHFYSMPLKYREGEKVYKKVVSDSQLKYGFTTDTSIRYKIKMQLYKVSKKFGLYGMLNSLRAKFFSGYKIKHTILDNMGWYELFDSAWLQKNMSPGDKFYPLLIKWYLHLLNSEDK